MKDSVIILIIIAMVIIGNVISQNILKQDSENLISKLEDLKENIEKTDIAKEKVNEIYELWEDIDSRWSIIITHQELDLIKTAILTIKAGIEIEDKRIAYEQIENSIFLVGHIKEKEALAKANEDLTKKVAELEKKAK